MIRFVFRFVGLLLLALGFFFLVHDGTKSIADQTLFISSVESLWSNIHQSSLASLQPTVERMVGPWAWTGVVKPYFLDQSVSLVLAIVGGIFILIGRKKKRLIGFEHSLVELRYSTPVSDESDRNYRMLSATEQDPRRAIRKLNLIGLAVVVVLVGGVGGWATTSQLSGAVIAPGTVVVESNVKKVQHPTGGVVGDIFVKEGSAVEAGQVVLRLDDTVTKATLGVVRSQLDEFTARQARLLAERDDAEAIAFPDELTLRRKDASVETALAGEEKLFLSRRSARTGQRAQLRERAAQMNEEIRGLSAQQAAKESEIELIGKELVGVTDLYRKNLVSISRFTQLQRDQTRLLGERGQLIADSARARGKISEIELQIIQLGQDFRTEVLKDLREAQGKIAELRERVTAAEDQLKRVELRAPQSGVVHQLSVHTVGGVIGNGETIMQIVPRADELVVEAKVAPQDIDQVALGTSVTVRIMAGNQRTAPELTGVITRVSADLTREQQQGSQPGPAYYTVRIALPAEQVTRLKDIRLVPGMPAEAFIQTHDRTPLQFLLKPLEEQIARTFRER
jgi:HlyD family secretion protein